MTAPDRKELESAIDKIGWRIKELRTFELGGIQERWDPRLEMLQSQVNTLLSDALGPRSAEYRQYAIGPMGAELDTAFGDRYSPDELRDAVRNSIDQAVANLNAVKQLLAQRLEAKDTAAPSPAPTAAPTAAPTPAPTAASPSTRGMNSMVSVHIHRARSSSGTACQLGMALESAAQRAVPMVRKASHSGADR